MNTNANTPIWSAGYSCYIGQGKIPKTAAEQARFDFHQHYDLEKKHSPRPSSNHCFTEPGTTLDEASPASSLATTGSRCSQNNRSGRLRFQEVKRIKDAVRSKLRRSARRHPAKNHVHKARNRGETWQARAQKLQRAEKEEWKTKGSREMDLLAKAMDEVAIEDHVGGFFQCEDDC